MNDQVKQLIVKKRMSEMTILSGLIVLAIAFAIYQMTEAILVSGVSAVVGFLLIFFGNSNFSHLRETFKEQFISDLLKEWMKDGSYNPGIGLSQIQVVASEFFDNPHTFHSEGLITGAVDKIPFLSSDITLQRTDNKKENPYFSGRMFIFQFNHAFNFSLQLLQDQKAQPKRDYRKSKTLNDLLHNRFNCYSTNVKEARKLLNAECRDALLTLDNNHYNSINISFVESKLFLAFNHQQDTFNFRFLKRLNTKQLINFQHDIELIHVLLDEVRHNPEIFTHF